MLIEGAEGLGLDCEGHWFCVVAVSMAPLGGVWGDWWTVPPLSQDLEVVQDHPILPNLSVDELVCLDGEQALRLCPGLAVDGLPGVRGDEDGVAGLVEVVHAVSMASPNGVWGVEWTVPQLAHAAFLASCSMIRGTTFERT